MAEFTPCYFPFTVVGPLGNMTFHRCAGTESAGSPMTNSNGWCATTPVYNPSSNPASPWGYCRPRGAAFSWPPWEIIGGLCVSAQLAFSKGIGTKSSPIRFLGLRPSNETAHFGTSRLISVTCGACVCAGPMPPRAAGMVMQAT